jgi:hypothetical protein
MKLTVLANIADSLAARRRDDVDPVRELPIVPELSVLDDQRDIVDAPAGGYCQRSISPSPTISRPALSARQIRLSPIDLSTEAPCQPGEVNHHPLMGASANFLDPVMRGHGEDYPSPFDPGDF